MLLNLEFDQSAMSAPQSFVDTVKTAARIIGQTFTDAITVNLAVGYGELTFGGTVDPLDQGRAEAAAVGYGIYNYSTVRDLLSHAVDREAASGVSALPAGNSFQGYTSVVVWSAEQKALGLTPADASGLDGATGFAADVPTNLLLGVALHELTHAMGRIASADGASPDVFDFYRFTSPGLRLVGDDLPSPQAYFSLDNGATDLADYGRTSDNSDYFDGGHTPNDAFNEFYGAGTQQQLSQVDLLQMQALGFHAAHATFATNGGGLVFWQNTISGMLSAWTLHDTAATATDLPGAVGWQAQDVGDFDGDGVRADVLFRNPATGGVSIWLETDGHMAAFDLGAVGLDWQIMGAADINGDGKSDVLWRNEHSGDVSVWEMNGAHATDSLVGGVGLNWRIVGAADYTGDGKADILWRDADTGVVGIWQVLPSGQAVGARVDAAALQWKVVGSGDFNGDGVADILWRDGSQVGVWEMGAGQVQASGEVGALGSEWQVAAVTDVNGDGKSDILWRDSVTGQVGVWDMNGLSVDHAGALGPVDASWQTINHHYDWA